MVSSFCVSALQLLNTWQHNTVQSRCCMEGFKLSSITSKLWKQARDFFCYWHLRKVTEFVSLRVVSLNEQKCFAGKLPKNHEILREAYSLCHRLPVLNTERFKDEFYNVSAISKSRGCFRVAFVASRCLRIPKVSFYSSNVTMSVSWLTWGRWQKDATPSIR